MTDVVEPGLLGDVREMPLTVITEENIPHPDGCHEEVLIAVVVDIRERTRDADPVLERDTRRRRDLLEAAATNVAPELVATDLIGEKDIVSTITIHISNGDAVAVVVVVRLVLDACVLDDMMDEGYAALLDLVLKAKVDEDLELIFRRHLLCGAIG